MFKNLLIAMDLSPASICLLPCVGSLRDVGAESATLLHVMDVHRVGGLYIPLKNLVEPLLKEKEKQLGTMGFRTRLDIPVGSPAFEINRIASETDASLIVIGTHGESLAKEFLLGSVVHRLLQMAEKPVLLIPITILEGEGEEKTCDVLCGDFFRHPLFATDSGPRIGPSITWISMGAHLCSLLPSSSLVWKLSGVLTGETECVVYSAYADISAIGTQHDPGRVAGEMDKKTKSASCCAAGPLMGEVLTNV